MSAEGRGECLSMATSMSLNASRLSLLLVDRTSDGADDQAELVRVQRLGRTEVVGDRGRHG